MEENKIILIGGGGHAGSLNEFAFSSIAGYLAPEASSETDLKWLGTDQLAPELIKNGYSFHMAFIYKGLPVMLERKKLIDYFKSIGASFSSLISPSAIITKSSSVGEGSAIMQGVIVNKAEIGYNAVINSGAIIEHNTRIGDNSFIGPGAVVGGFVNIGSDCFIGLGCNIKNGVTIASGVSVAMGANINNDLLEPGIYHGSPLRLHKIKYPG